MSEDPSVEFLMRTPATNGPQPCDAACERWGALPHPHLHFDGLYNEHAAKVTLAGYCSCGVCFDPPVDYKKPDDMQLRYPSVVSEERGFAAAVGRHAETQVARFVEHMAQAHGINIETDQAWQTAASREPE